MKLNADILRRLGALNLSGEHLAGVLSILADIEAVDDARQKEEIEKREAARERTRKWRLNKKRHGDVVSDVTVISPRCHGDGHGDVTPPMVSPTPPSLNPPEVPKPTVSADAGPTQAELEKELFRRGRQVCGKASGGLIASLLKAKQHDVALARAVIETAATKHDPREYVAASTRNHINGAANPTMAAFDRLDARNALHEGQGDFGGLDLGGPIIEGR